MTRRLYENDAPGYAGALDSALAGARNGFSALIPWDYMAKHGYEDQREKAIDLIKRARDAERKLTDLEKTLQEVRKLILSKLPCRPGLLWLDLRNRMTR